MIIMGTKGAKLTGEATEMADQMIEKLQSLGAISAKKMFGGYGLFYDSKMFGLISSNGQVYFKVTEENKSRYENIGAEKYGKMPYYSVSKKIIDDPDSLLEWTREAIEVSKS